MENEKYVSEVRLSFPVDEDSYLSKVPIVKYLEERGPIPITKNVTFFVGENGTGKSTLIEAIAVACGFNAEGGSRSFSFSTVGGKPGLWDYINVVRDRYPQDGFFLRAESFFNVATHIDELDRFSGDGPKIIDGYGGVSLHEQSHGESFLALVHNRFFGNGLYIMDEPEAALSPMKLITLIAEIGRLVDCDSQFIIATHSPVLMAYPGAEIYQITDNDVRSVNYKETDHYTVMRSFFDNPEIVMEYLLDKQQ